MLILQLPSEASEMGVSTEIVRGYEKTAYLQKVPPQIPNTPNKNSLQLKTSSNSAECSTPDVRPSSEHTTE